MEKIKFNNLDTVYNCNLIFVKNGVVKITFNDNIIPSEDITLSGFFLLNEYNLDIMSDYSNYTTKYKDSDEDKTFYLSTGEIYSDSPISDEINKIPEKELTEEEKEALVKAELEQAKKNKIAEINSDCNKMIINGVDIEINGTIEHFSYTLEDQANIDDIAEMAKTTKLGQSWHCDGGTCKIYTLEDIVKLYMTQKMNKAHHITYANQLKLYIESLIEKTDVEAVTYGQELIGDYLNTYNINMEHEEKVSQLFFKSIQEV